MGIFDNFFEDVVDGFTGTDYLKDFTHASKLMRSDAFALAPNNKFLFHVYFTLNVPGVSNDNGLVGALVKSVALPSFDLATEEVVQYNRKRNVPTRINYRPVTIKFHDDASDTVRSMWHNYYKFYFSDTDYNYDPSDGNTSAYTRRNIYDNLINEDTWGVSTKNNQGGYKPAFFKDITIYGMSRKNFVTYTLINPVITEWTHDTYDYEQSAGVMEHTMTLKYEAVKYGRGKIKRGAPDGNGVLGFGNVDRYDTDPSPLGKAGSTASIFGQAGLLDTGAGIFEDLSSGNILGAIKKGATSYKTFKNADLSFKNILKDDVLREAADQLPGVVTALSKKSGIAYPKASQSGTNNGAKVSSVQTRPTPISDQET